MTVWANICKPGQNVPSWRVAVEEGNEPLPHHHFRSRARELVLVISNHLQNLARILKLHCVARAQVDRNEISQVSLSKINQLRVCQAVLSFVILWAKTGQRRVVVYLQQGRLFRNPHASAHAVS